MFTTDLDKIISASVKTVTGKTRVKVVLTEPTDPKFGDASTTIALELAKPLKKSPRQIAEEIITALPQTELILRTEIAGPGYINFFLSDPTFHAAFQKLYKKIEQKKLGKLTLGKGKTAITDTSNPNVAKPMGVHHLLATVIGQAVNNLLATSGYTLIKDNYLGDWGTQFGKLIVAIRKWGDMKIIEKDPIPELLKLYVRFHDEAEKDTTLEDEGRAEFKKLEDGDKENRKRWQWIRELSLASFKIIWDRLGVSFDMIHGEGYYEDKLKGIIDEAMEKGIAVRGEKDALIIPMNDPNMPPCIIQKSDGATTYATRDLARIRDWNETYHADIGIVLCDIAQKLHHDQVNEAADKLGWNTKESIRVHFGRMSFPGGVARSAVRSGEKLSSAKLIGTKDAEPVKSSEILSGIASASPLDGAMSTRKGKVVLLEDVLDEAEKRAFTKIEEHKSGLPEREKRELARKMGIGAIKYNILSQNRFKNYTFDWNQMLSFEGNSAPYLQYAYTRTQSVLRKNGPLKNSFSRGLGDALRRPTEGGLSELIAVSSRKGVFQPPIGLATEEKSLIKKLLNYEETIEQSLKQYKPNLLCTYLFELAQVFSHFYNNLRILEAETDEKRRLRLSLVTTTGAVLKHGLGLLGIEVPERM